MKYEVRYLVDEQEYTDVVDVETAAEAAARVQERHAGPDRNFELIQVHLVEDGAGDEAPESVTASRP